MIFRKKQIIDLFFLLSCIFLGSGGQAQEIQSQPGFNQLKETVYFLASDQLKGRRSGEEGDSIAAQYIRNQFINAGLELLYDDGFQYFSLVSSVYIGNDNILLFNDINYEIETDFLPYSFSSSKRVTAPVVFNGYGFDIDLDSLQWKDYSDISVKGKWVLLLKGDPEIDQPASVFAPFSEERAKVLKAQDKGAAGVLLVAGREFNEKDELQGLFYDKNSSTYSIPVIQITRKLADQILSKSNSTIEELETRINSSRKPAVFDTNVSLTGKADVVQNTASTRNVVAILRGIDPLLKNEYVVVGAHYDHLGMGGPGSGSRAPDTTAVHYGADDNASGVAAVIELAIKASMEKNNRRSIIFAAFGAEEMGLIGATAFTANPPADLANVVAMFNFDMVGRLDTKNRSLSIGGTQTAIQSEEMITRLNPGFSLNLSPEGSGPSDHAAFYMQNIPVFFISTGAHGDYHTPADVAEKINFEGIYDIVEYIWTLVQEVDNQEYALTFQESGSKSRRSRGGRLKVTLGVMPDFAGQEKSGLRIDAVTKGKPASLGGMQKGDIITAINGNLVGNIYDYMNRLNSLEEGQTISVDIMREGKPMVLIVQL
jgi:aminopeptidase YwaD